ncbi:GTP pyrophosphokinase [Holdemanella biformis]|uniref:GTP pyrophosphokinase n=1 Tax=Holdemanella biformis TaxID=1735 RepID=UPI003AB3843F
MIIKDIILVREPSLTFFKPILSIVSYVYGMTYKEFYGTDYDKFKNVLDHVLNTIHSSSLVCIQYTTSRIKSPESVLKKIGNDYALLHDIIGVRIICSFVDEIYEVKDWINFSFEVVQVRDYLRHPKPSGYRSLHVIINVDGCLVEIQVRTIALDFWTNLEHQIHYKKDIEDEELIRSELKRCADEIASLDLSFQTIKDRIEG